MQPLSHIYLSTLKASRIIWQFKASNSIFVYWKQILETFCTNKSFEYITKRYENQENRGQYRLDYYFNEIILVALWSRRCGSYRRDKELKYK